MGKRGSYERYVYWRIGRTDREGRLIRRFIEKGKLSGQFIEEFPLRKGKTHDRVDIICVERVKEEKYPIFKEPIFFPASSKLALDTIARGEKGDTIWIIEVKNSIDRIKEAFGQVLVYAELFSEEYPQYNLKKAILCPKPSTEEKRAELDIYRKILKKYAVEIFTV